MAGQRTDLQAILEGILGIPQQVYFQPPANVTMVYPAIVYERNYGFDAYGDNNPYSRWWRYQVTLISRNPDDPVIEKLAGLPMSKYVRHFAVDNLDHNIFNVYF